MMTKFNKNLALVAVVGLLICAMARAGIDPSNKFKLGDGANTTKIVEANIGSGANNPKLQYNAGTSKWQNCVAGTCTDIGSGSGGGGGGVSLLTTDDNPGFELGTSQWTASGGTFTSITSGQLYGTTSGQWDASALNQTLYSNLKALSGQPALTGNNCLAGISYSYSGTSGDYSLVVSDGTNVIAGPQALSSATTAQDASISFVCPSSGSVKVGLIASVSNPSAIKVDGASYNGGSVILGSNVLLNNLTQATFFGSGQYAPTSNCGVAWVVANSGSYSDFSADTNCAAMTTKGSVVAPVTKVPQWTLSAMTPGIYKMHLDFGFDMAVGSNSRCQLVDDLGTVIGQVYHDDNFGGNQAMQWDISGEVTYSTAQTRTVKLQCLSNQSNGQLRVGSTQMPMTLSVYKFPNSTQQVYSAFNTPLSWSGYHTVSTGWSTTSATYADPSSGGTIVLTQTSARNMVCTADATLPAISCPITKAGRFRVKAIVSLMNNTASAQVSARLVDGSSTIIDPGRSTVDGAGNNHLSIALEGLYVSSGTGNVTFKVQGATNSGNSLQVANGVAAGSGAIQWVVEDADAANAAPVLVGTNIVASSAVGTEYSERVVFGGTGGTLTSPSNCTSSPCAIFSSTPGVTSVTRTSTGSYSINFASGTFSTIPTCVCSMDGNDGIACAVSNRNGFSATQVKINTYRDFTTSIDSNVNMICRGPH